MTLTPYQIVVPILAIFAILYAWNFAIRKKKRRSGKPFSGRFFWGVIAGIAFYPSILGYLTALTGIKNQVNAILVTSIGILFFMVFYMVIRMEEMNQKQTRIVRALALREAGLDEDSKDAHENNSSH